MSSEPTEKSGGRPQEETEHVVTSFESDGTPGITWIVLEGTFVESLDEPYSLHLTLASDDSLAEPSKMLGLNCRLTMYRGAVIRTVTGIVSELSEGDAHPQLVTTVVTVKPAFEALRHRVNTKIFQEKTVPDILQEVLQEGLGTFDRTLDLSLHRSYPICEYRTQYNESDLEFCERLMEEEGITYWFEFASDGYERLILSDASTNFGEVECLQTSLPSSVLLYTTYEGQVLGHEYIKSFRATSQIRPTKVATRHFDWTHASLPFEASETDATQTPQPNGALLPPEREIYEHDDLPLTFHSYNGLAYSQNDKDVQARIRREVQAVDSRIAEAQSTVLGVTASKQFTLSGHPRSDLDGQYLIISVTHSFGDTSQDYENQFSCIPAEVVYRPKRIRIKPRISGIQTATVVGPAGEEIHTDEHGRIKVQFHWDRLGRMDEHSSCWIRVMQPWGGAGWGFSFIPRMGMEVVIHFVNGDPDLPLVAGSVYNGDKAPPYPLPASKTMSTLKTESSLGGGGFNELRFEDQGEHEEIYAHAQKDYNEVVEHDHSTLIHNDQSNTVDRDQNSTVHRDQFCTVNRHRTTGVVGNQSATIQGNDTSSVLGTQSQSVTGDQTISLGSNRTVSVSSSDSLSVGGSKSVSVSGSMTESVSSSKTESVSTVYTQSVTGAHNVSVGGIKSEEVGISYNVSSGVTYTLNAGSTILVTCGAASIKLSSDGTIKLSGVNIELEGSGIITSKAPKIEQNC